MAFIFKGSSWQPSPSSELPFRHDSVIEGARAWAAIAVLYAHLTAPFTMLDPKFAPPEVFWRFEAALPAVLFFFLLSGYVIGLTKREPASFSGTRNYLYRRCVRLLPIYFVAVIFGWMTLPGPSLKDLIGNFLLLQNAAPDNPTGIELLRGNMNLWSLHYEAIYYLIFLGIWWLRPKIWLTLVIPVIIGLAGVFVQGFPIWLAWLSCGFIFWLVGLFAAWRLPYDEHAGRSPWPAVLLLTLLTWKLQMSQAVLAKIGYEVPWIVGVIFPYLDMLPVIFWLFLLLSSRRFGGIRGLEMVCWLMPLAILVWQLWEGRAGGIGPSSTNLMLLVTAALFRFWQPSLAILRKFAPVGAMSYGIYAFGAPAQHLVYRSLPEFSGTWLTYALRIPVVLILAFGAAWIFEIWLQPKIRCLIDSIVSGRLFKMRPIQSDSGLS